MSTNRRVHIALVLFALLFAGCSREVQQPDSGADASAVTEPDVDISELAVDVQPSGPCVDAMESAAAESDSTRAEPLLVATLDACETVNEWLAALRSHPAAMGLTPDAVIGQLEVQAMCGDPAVRGRPMCVDAVATGVLPTDFWD